MYTSNLTVTYYLNAAKDATIACNGDLFGFCLDKIDGNFFGFLLEVIIFLFSLISIGNIVDIKLVPALEALSDRWQLKEDVAGATLLAMGSSAPDIVISCITSFEGGESMELGVGSIFGSGLLAFLVLTGLSALFAPAALFVKRRALIRDFVFYICSLALVWIFISDKKFTIGESVCLLCIYIVYVIFLLYFPTIKRFLCKTACRSHDDMIAEEDKEDVFAGEADTLAQKKKRSKYSKTLMVAFLSKCMVASKAKKIESNWYAFWGTIGKVFTVPANFIIKYTIPPHELKEGVFSYVALATMLISFVFIAFWSFLLTTMVDRWSIMIEEANPTSEGLKSLMGLTLIAWGSAVPDTIQAINVAKKGLGSMAVASCIGSLIINIGVGMGLPYLIVSAADPRGYFDFEFLDQFNSLLVFFGLTIGCVIIFKQEKVQLNRMKGAALLGTYVVLVFFFALQVMGVF
ncbi:hypothetical protein WA158_008165 [Blastocystis sp. Blastoise]